MLERGDDRKPDVLVPMRLAGQLSKIAGLAAAISLSVAVSLSAEAIVADALFETCHEQGLAQSITREGAECFFAVAFDNEAKPEAVSELTELIEQHPDEAWLRYYRGRVLGWGGGGGEKDVREAAEMFLARDEVQGEIRARSNLVTWMGFERRVDEAAEQLARLRILKPKSSAESRALVLKAEAEYQMLKGGDLELAYRRLLGALDVLLASGVADYRDLRDCYRSLVDVALDLGLDSDANYFAERAVQFVAESGNLRDQATAGYNAFDTRLATELPSDSGRKRLLGELDDVLQLARRAGHKEIEAKVLLFIAEMKGGTEAGKNLERCIELAQAIDDPDLEGRCLLALANLRVENSPDEARRLLAEAYDRSLEHAGPWTLLFGWADHLNVLWNTQPREQALGGAEAVLDAIETMRRAQVGDASDRLLSVWADAYYWLSGRLLQGAPARDEVEMAFQAIERLRAQTLRETLEADGEPAPPLPVPLAERREELEQQFVEIYRALLDPNLSEPNRDWTLARLEELERQQGDLQSEIAARSGPRRSLAPPPRDLLARVQANLAEDEALLSFQLGLWRGWDRRFAGGAFVLVVTRDVVGVYPLEGDRGSLESMIRHFLGLPARDDARKTSRLYRELLQPALAELPANIRELVIVPDGILHLFPFSILRATVTSPTLIERFQLKTVPSASLWLHWKEDAKRPAAGIPDAAGLVIANPELAALAESSSERAGDLRARSNLGTLRYAEREGRVVLRHLGGAGQLLSGPEASEKALKNLDLAAFSIVHFAAHAVIDSAKPGRSAIMLAPTPGLEDGLLRPSEIAELSGLDRKLVVLSACDTASGDVLRGEGALSLVRPFLAAGAQAVIASLWPLDDKLATAFFDDFYRQLSTGSSVAEALAETQRQWIAGGRPAVMWAGVVVQGNGDLIPLPGGVHRAPTRLLVAGATALALLLGLLAVLRLRGRGSR